MMMKRQVKVHKAAKDYKSPTSCDLLVAPGEADGQKYLQILVKANGPLTSDVVCGLTLSEKSAREHILALQKGLDPNLTKEREGTVEIPALNHVVNTINAVAVFTDAVITTGQPRTAEEAEIVETAAGVLEKVVREAKLFCHRLDTRDPLTRRFGFLSGYALRNDEEEADVRALDRVLRIRGDHPGWHIVDREIQA